MAEMGITRLADVTGLDRIGLPVFMAVRPNSRSLSVAQGKGVTRDAAVASALMEAVESWHCERVEVPLVYDSYASLSKRARTIEATRLPVIKGNVFEPSSPLLWAEAAEVATDEPVWVPFECISTNFVKPQRAGATFIASTNGLASGNHRLEAIVHGLCELIERDAYALWLARGASKQVGTQLNLSTVRDDSVQDLLSRLSAAAMLVAVWDMTADAGVPAFYCEIVDDPHTPRWATIGVCPGTGCHLDAVVALLRAVTEAVQSRLTYISGSRDDMFDYETAANLDDVRATAELAQRPADKAFSDVDLSRETFEDDVTLLSGALAGIGVEDVAVVDLTRSEIGIPVVKVLAAGLETDPGYPSYAAGERVLAAIGNRT
jgi:ribosomal protein S12 methylthiotransferase accessory factor